MSARFLHAGPRPVPVLAALAAALLCTPVLAQHHGGYGGTHGAPGGHGGHGGYNGHGAGHGGYGGHGRRGGPGWHGGHWHHGAYGGRNGWWWVVGPSWYYYPAPAYPYPSPYPAPPGYLLYCPSFVAYYPAVTVCPGGWSLTPAGP